MQSSVSQQVDRDPILGRGHLLLGRQNLCFSTMIVIKGSPKAYYSVLWVANYQTLRTADVEDMFKMNSQSQICKIPNKSRAARIAFKKFTHFLQRVRKTFKIPGVNFINVLHAPFCTKVFCTAFHQLQFGFVIFLAQEYGHKSCS